MAILTPGIQPTNHESFRDPPPHIHTNSGTLSIHEIISIEMGCSVTLYIS